MNAYTNHMPRINSEGVDTYVVNEERVMLMLEEGEGMKFNITLWSALSSLMIYIYKTGLISGWGGGGLVYVCFKYTGCY